MKRTLMAKGPRIILSETVIDMTDEKKVRELIEASNAPRPIEGRIVINDEDQEAPEPPDTGNKEPIIEAQLTEIQEEGKEPVRVQEKKEKIVTVRGGNTYAERLAFKHTNLNNMIRRRDELNKSIARVKKELVELEKAKKMLDEM